MCVLVCYLWLCRGRGIWLLNQQLTLLHPLGHHGAGACGHPATGLCCGSLLGQGSLQPLHNTTHTNTHRCWTTELVVLRPCPIHTPLSVFFVEVGELKKSWSASTLSFLKKTFLHCFVSVLAKLRPPYTSVDKQKVLTRCHLHSFNNTGISDWGLNSNPSGNNVQRQEKHKNRTKS